MRNAECNEAMAVMDQPRDIHDRALEYGVRAIKLCRFLQKSRDFAAITIGKQYLRSATSIGANMEEASAAETRADFIHNCSIAQKEARECLYWLQLMTCAEIVRAKRIQELLGETKELVAVITTIARNARKRTE